MDVLPFTFSNNKARTEPPSAPFIPACFRGRLFDLVATTDRFLYRLELCSIATVGLPDGYQPAFQLSRFGIMKWTSVPLSVLAVTLAMGIASMQQVSAQQPPPPPPGGAPPPQMAAPPPDPNAPPPPSANGPVAGPGQAPLAQTMYSRRGTIKAFNSGPNGETNGFILSDGTAILFPAEMGDQFRSTVREGSRISVTGMSRAGVSGRMVVNAQTITANGQTFTAPGPPPPDGPPPPGGRGGRGPRPGPPPPPAGGPPPPPPGRGPASPDDL
jgi:hypothetical protein